MLYAARALRRHPGSRTDYREPGPKEDCSMTIEIFYLTTQIHNWLNVRVARHLAAQAAKLTHYTG
jgi:hypothetical protein